MTSAHQRAAQMLAVAADFLELGQPVNRLSVAVTAIGVGVLVLPLVPPSQATQPTGMVVAILGVIELFLAARVTLEATRFRRLAADASAERLDIAAFDAALVALRFILPTKAGRTVARRFATARRYLIAQVAVFLLQMAAAIVGGYMSTFNGL
jgi:hypothetical protein